MFVANPLPLTKDITEKDLIGLIRSQNQEGFDLLYENYGAMLLGVINRIVRDEAVANELLQTVIVKIWRGISQYEESKELLYTWMLNIARAESNAHLARMGDHRSALHKSGNVPFVVLSVDINNEGLRAAGELDPEYKEALDAVFFDGNSYEEAANRLDISVGTLKTRLRTALQILREK